MFSAGLQGLLLGGSMIIPIGAQNAYILNQGIKRNHHLMTASICILCDVVTVKPSSIVPRRTVKKLFSRHCGVTAWQ